MFTNEHPKNDLPFIERLL